MYKVSFTLYLIFFAFSIQAQNLFTPPSATFYHTPSEKITDLSFSNGTIADIQAAINDTRNNFPNNIIRITLTGTFTITDNPIQLGSFMLLFLNNAIIQANAGCTATSLVQISNSEYVSISSAENGRLEGNNSINTAIEVNTSGKTHIDNLTIRNCKSEGIAYSGNGMTVFADAGSVTRCNISNCGNSGIHYADVFNFICTDNNIQTCSTGITINGNYAAFSNNTITNCTTGIQDSSQYDAATYNTISNCTNGIFLASTSYESLIAYNKISNNNVGFTVNSTKARIYYNTCQNTTQVNGNGSNNQLFCNIGITSAQGNVTSCTFFNPPLINNIHNDFIKPGKSRFDVSIGSYPLETVRCLIDAAHTYQPDAVIVAHLIGDYTTTSSTDSLLIKEDECIILTGKINGQGNCATLINFSGNTTSSFSGGTVDGQTSNGTKGLVYVSGAANAVIDQVTIQNGAAQGIFKQNSTSPTFISACTIIKNASRGIWNLASSRLFAFENNVSGSINYDGIDLDAFSSNSVLLKNVCSNNHRNGIFIEEGASKNIIQANILDSNSTAGVQLYNLNVNNFYSSQNLIAQNHCERNSRGILVNASAATKASINNVLFNNTCINNTDVGLGGYYNASNTYNNYNALMNIQNNTNGAYYAARNYSANYDWNMY